VREGTAAFDWFEYRGDDSVFRTVKAGPNEYLNPILAGFYPDPSIVRAGNDYYLVTSSFAYFPGVPIFHSTDLVSWTQIGSVLDRPSQLNLDSAGVSRGIFAPALSYHDGTFYMITTMVDRGGNFFVTAKNPAGPWSDPVWLREIDGIDPSFFFDDDGKAYVVNNGPPIGTPLYQGHRAIWIQEFDVATQKLAGPRSVIVNGGVDLSKKPIWIEAPHIFKKDRHYYLICAEGGTAYEHSEVVFRSESPRGPYAPHSGNPILTQRHLDRSRRFPITTTGHADFVQTQNGEWWAVFLGVRPYEGLHYNNGRETYMLPVRWKDGWPMILEGSATVPYVNARPDLPHAARPPIPTAGNFTVRDEFDAPTLAPYWEFLRTPRTRWYDLAERPGSLTIKALPVDLSDPRQPAFIGRRQQHEVASVSAAMRFVPTTLYSKAGLVAMQNTEHYYFLGVVLIRGKPAVEVEERDSATRFVGASPPLDIKPGEPVYLQIRARGSRYDFLYALRPDDWRVLVRDLDGTLLSTERAGGFVGTMFGMYVYSGQ
jgi:xylan 1,4-beta-xylosidase